MQIYYYLLPVLVIGLVVGLSLFARSRAVQQIQNLSPEQAGQRFHDFYRAARSDTPASDPSSRRSVEP